MYILGFDIGGTKCAVITAEWDGEHVTLLKKEKCATDLGIRPEDMIYKLISMADAILDRTPDKIGISCGGPLDSERGVIMSPPNLPGWDNVEIVKLIENRYGAPTYLQNDANACALAEWKFGAGRGSRNMIFLTFGTGLGAGLILDGRLYSGTNGNAGEIGHVRVDADGPIGYGKAGSLEGFCSGGGIAKLGIAMARESIKTGRYPTYFTEDTSEVSARAIAEAAESGDATAIEVYRTSGRYLGFGLAMLIDVLNPEKIVIGSVFARSGHLMREAMEAEIEKEALPMSADVCKIVAAELGEAIGDFAAVAAVFM